MTLARRLPRGGGGSLVAPPTTWTLTAPDDGGWTHANAPKAVESGGLVFFGYVDMASGNLEVRSFDLATYSVSSAAVIAASFEANTHAAPSLFVRNDGRLLVAYSKHDGSTMYRRVSTNVLPDLSAFDAAADLDASLGGLNYTYPVIVRYAGDLWLFYRDWQGGDTAVLVYSVSSDEGATWSAQAELYESAGRQSYWSIDSDGSRIDIVASDGRNPPNADPVTIVHMYYDGSWRTSNGTAITGATPYAPAKLTTVYAAGDGMGWPMDIVSGTAPVFTYAVLNDPHSNSWRRAHWNGAAWVNRTIDESDGDIDSGFASSVCLDHTDPTHQAYAPVKVAGQWQMFAHTTSDSGATWTARPMTSGTDDHLTPEPVYGSTGLVRILWMSGGPYVSYLSGGFGLSAGR